METINKVLEAFNLNNISSNNEIDFNFLKLLDSEEKNDEYKMEVIQDPEFDLLAFIFNRYYYIYVN